MNDQKRKISGRIQIGDITQYWKKAKEKTESSFLGLHFDHFKSMTESKMIPAFQTSFLDIVINTGMVLLRWSKGLSIVL